MSATIPACVPTTYSEACTRLLTASGRHDDDLSLDGIGRTTSLSDVALANWWSGDCTIRDDVWSAASRGDCAAIDWLFWTISLADARHHSAFVGLLAVDLCDVSQLTMAVAHGDDVDSILASERSPSNVGGWLEAASIQPATTAWDAMRFEGSNSTTEAWLHGRATSKSSQFDAVVEAAITGALVVVEFDDHFRRHVLAPAGATGPDHIDSDHHCIELVTGRSGWLTRLGRWTWAPLAAAFGPGSELSRPAL